MISQALLVSVVSYLLVAFLKWHPSIPVSEGQVAKLRTIASVLTLAGSSLSELIQNGFNIAQFAQAHNLVATVSTWLLAWLASHLIHKGVNLISA